ncbi:MAG: hypothetical protein IKS83_09505 [Victivallales bacterium]|nr:hypothetical protein [Victivallales bacterium]
MTRLINSLCLILCLTGFTALAQVPTTRWDFTQTAGSAAYSKPTRLTISQTDEGLLLELTGPDSSFQLDGLRINPEKYDGISLEYQAEGFDVGSTTGQIFFANEANASFTNERYFRLSSLNLDGQWHQMTVRAGDIAYDTDAWTNGGNITKLRIDLADQTPGRIRLRHITLLPVRQSRAAKRGLPDRIPVHLGETSVKSHDKETPTYDTHAPGFASPIVAPAGGFYETKSLYIRQDFQLEAPARQALLQTICDDAVEAAYLNGVKLEVKWTTSWRDTQLVELDPALLHPGRNVLAFRYVNEGSIGGLMADLQIIDEQGKYIVVTLEDAKGSREMHPGWETPEFDDHAWKTCEKRPGPPAAPWLHTPDFVSIKPATGQVQVAIRSFEQTRQVVAFSGTPAIRDDEYLYARLYSDKGALICFRSGTSADLQATRESDGTLVVTFEGCDIPTYGGKFDARWEFGVYDRELGGEATRDFEVPARPVPGPPAVLKLRQTPDGPIPELNGKPFFFNIVCVEHYNTPTGMEGGASPINIAALRLGGHAPPWWVGPDEYDFSPVDRQMNMLLERYPDAMLGVYLWCQPPTWYQQMYPERISLNENGLPVNYYVATVNFANEDYLQDAERAIRALVEYLEKHYGARMVLYNLMGGATCEWQGWNSHTQYFADYSEGHGRDFQRYASQQGLEVPAGTPTRAERTASLPGGIFRKPDRDWKAMLYDRFYNDSMAQCVLRLAKVTREASHGNALVGAYFGYHLEYSELGYCVNAGGHNSFRMLLDSPDLDFFISPFSYGLRSIGAPGADMKPHGAIRAAGKLDLIEDDTRTNITVKTGYDQTYNLPHTLAVLERNQGLCLTRGNPFYYLPLTEGNEFDAPEIYQMMQKGVQAGQIALESSHPPIAPEVAFVIDERSLEYLVPTRATYSFPETARYAYSAESGKFTECSRGILPLSGELLYYQRYIVSQFGAPVDWILLDDVPSLAGQYKLVVFADAFADTPLLRQAFEACRQAGTAILVTYGAGFLDRQGVNTQTMSDLLGMNIKEVAPASLELRLADNDELTGHAYPVQPRFAVADQGATTLGTYQADGAAAVAAKGNVIFYGGAELSRNFLRENARAAGAHIYCETDDNFFAGNGFICIHANQAGTKVIRLPETTESAVEIYTGEILGSNTDTLVFTMDGFDTKVIMLGPAALRMAK